MNKPVDWRSITVPLDVTDIEMGSHHLRRWLAFERTGQGLLFRCEMANGQQVTFQVDVVEPDVVRVRMSQDEIRDEPSDMLLPPEQGRQPSPFDITERQDVLILSTSRLRLEFPRFPWQMRVFGVEGTARAAPFFSEQCYDRAYGLYYEVPPPGFDEYGDGHLTARETVAVTPGEAFYGFGERFTPLDKWGQELVLWTADSGNVSSTRSYKNIPFLMSTAGYGLFVHSSCPMVFRMGSESSISYSIHVDEGHLDYYPLLYNQAVFELTEDYFGRGFTWARSAYAGSQRYPVHWGGDSYSSLDQMACQIRGLLSYGMSGVPFCSHDVGGFDYPPQAFDHSERSSQWFLREHAPDPVVYVRWLQFGVFSSHVRAHGKQPREPYAYGPQAEAIARRYLKLRYRLLPYIYSQAVQSARTGVPMARAMVLEYLSDPSTYRLDLQYMFGDSFLVAPVVSPTNRCRVYLPAGDWLDYWSKQVRMGGQWIEVEAPLEILPLWVRAGAIVPMGPDQSYAEEKPLEPLTLELYQPEGEVHTVVHDEDRPDIPVRYARRPGHLTVEAGPSPGQVEIVLYGVPAVKASLDGQPLTLGETPGGQFVCLDGTNGTTIDFQLDGRH